MIIYENDKIIAINKPSDISSQGGKRVKASIDLLASAYVKEGEANLIHRLDKDTTGTMVIAKGKLMAQKISAVIHREIEKKYLAVVEGRSKIKGEQILVSDETCTHFDLLNSLEEIRESQMVSSFKKIAEYLDDTPRTLYRVLLHTGKKHQIRKHCALCLHTPIIGDSYYKGKEAQNLLLHSYSVNFSGNIKNLLGIDHLVSPIPEYFPKFSLSLL
eukprot:TRINITY_DN14810_c0_g2_i1.p1 TRINITY_DN14810_c0_g2~~TRINITY_DN14810_c0_g2_i1.p1  ORF type:complete len:216 (+),score=21.73 TRINITY_DN14810_c0_g2_i1:180-827(+)